MKRLLLIRHAKAASKDDPNIDDFDRPLTDRGRNDATIMGKTLKTRDLVPEAILSSPALRAWETARLVAQGAGMAVSRLSAEDTLYEASAAGLLKRIRRTDEACEALGVVGHNPAMEELVRVLGGVRVERLGTGAIAVLSVTGWRDLGPGKGMLEAILDPADFGGGKQG